MNKIYGFGNALLDIEIQIKEDDLLEIDIPKNTMKHIPDDQLIEYLEKYNNKINSINPGGSIANTIHAASRNGADTFFSFSVGDDEYGQLFVESYKNQNYISFTKSEYKTGICLIFVTPDGNRTMAANLGANNQLSKNSLDLTKLHEADFLIFDNFALSSISNFDELDFLFDLKHKTKICFGISDVSLVEENLQLLKRLALLNLFLVFGNGQEIKALKKLVKLNTENYLVSEGKNGATFNEIKVNAPETNVINTNGAGDALVGVLLANYNKLSLEDCLNTAVEYASKVCSVNGPRLK